MTDIDFKKIHICIANLRQNPPKDPLAQLQAEALICEVQTAIADAKEALERRQRREKLPGEDYFVVRRGKTWFTFCDGQLIAENSTKGAAYRDAWEHQKDPEAFAEAELEMLLQAARELLSSQEPISEACNVLAEGGCTSVVVAGIAGSGLAFMTDSDEVVAEVEDLLRGRQVGGGHAV